MSEPPIAVLAVADTDSYLKWSLATLAAWPADWAATQLVIDNPVRPSAAQMRAAGGVGVQILRRGAVLRRIRAEQPDVVLLACTGPVVAALTDASVLRAEGRPVLVTGLPGISIPASRRAVELRAGCDLFLVHSRRELAAFTAIGSDLGAAPEFGLSTLPFLSRPPAAAGLGGGITTPAPVRERVVFAAQATVPAARRDREAILLALADHGEAVVKVRSRPGEEQTHRESWPYPELLADLVAMHRLPPDAVVVQAGPVAQALRGATGLATVSSTAALEAVSTGVPILIISDFGVTAEMINVAFADSGCLGTLTDLRQGRFTHPDPTWSRDNYFHPTADNDAETRLQSLINRRWAADLPVHDGSFPAGWPALRRRLRLWLPALFLSALGRSVARRLTGWRRRRSSRVAAAARDHRALAPPRGHRRG